MPTVARWPEGVAVTDDGGQVRLLILQRPDDDTLARWRELYPDLPVDDAVQEFEEAGYGGT